MCGIVGFITNETKILEDSRARFLKQALIVDTLRGDDSTGVFGVAHTQEDTGPYWCKEVADGYQFTTGDAYVENFFDVSRYRAAVGHNRAATMGSIDAAGAHPFVDGPITLVHNGTLTRTGNLPIPMRSLEDVTIDSHAIACNLAKHTVEEVVATLDGAFVLVWHDNRDDSMNIIRNSKRPFHMAKGSNQDTLFFASEGGMLDFIASRVNIKLGSIYYPKEGQHLKWLPDTELTAPIAVELDLYEDDWGYNSRVTHYSGMGGYWDSSEGVWVDDEDDQNDWRQAGPSGGKYSLPQDDMVLVGGRKKEVPMLLQEELLKYDLVVEDRVDFIPKVKRSIGNLRIQVFGLLPGGYKAVILSTLQAWGADGIMARTWTVRPIAVYAKPSGEPTIIVRLVETTGKAHTTKTRPRQETGVLGWDIDEEGEEMRYMGPYGVLISRTRFLELTAGGCGFCDCPLSPNQDLSIHWIDNGKVPLCGPCNEKSHNYAEEIDHDE